MFSTYPGKGVLCMRVALQHLCGELGKTLVSRKKVAEWNLQTAPMIVKSPRLGWAKHLKEAALSDI